MTAVSEHEAARRARSLEAHGFRRAAIDVLEAALIEDPNAGALWGLRGVMLAREGRRAEAFANVEQALALSPLGSEALLVLADGYARAGLTASSVDVYLQLADDEHRPYEMWSPIFAGLFRAKRWPAALAVCRRAAEDRPDDDGAYFAMAQTLARMGRPAGTIIAVLSKAIDLNPVDPRYRVLLAMQLLRCDKRPEAYSCVAELAPQAFGSLACACCAWKLLRLCVTYGDEERSAVFGARLAQLSSTRRVQGSGEESVQ